MMSGRPPMDPRAASKLDRIAELIARGMELPNPVLPGVIRDDLGTEAIPSSNSQDERFVVVEVGATWVRAAYLPPIPLELDKPCFVMRSSRKAGAPWLVIATNYQVPTPPPIQVGVLELIDVDPGPDGIQGTGDDDPGGEGEGIMVDDDGRILVEYA